MVDKYNQIIIEKVENGFIMSVQTKEVSGGLFGSMKQVDKKHLVAKDIKEVEALIKSEGAKLVTTSELLKHLEEQKEKDNELKFE